MSNKGKPLRKKIFGGFKETRKRQYIQNKKVRREIRGQLVKGIKQKEREIGVLERQLHTARLELASIVGIGDAVHNLKVLLGRKIEYFEGELSKKRSYVARQQVSLNRLSDS